MEVRSYYATSIENAMAEARRELGPEAMLVRSRPSPPELQRLGRYEVVFTSEAPSLRQAPGLIEAPPRAKDSRTFLEIPELEPLDLIGRPGSPQDPEAARFLQRLATVPPARKPAASPHPAGSAPAGPIAPLRCAPGLGYSRGYAQTAALIGPSGAGRTSTIMKLALSRGVLASRAVRLLAFDPHCVGATAQLRHFAALLNIPFAEFDTEEELSSALEDHFQGLTLIDTAGCGPRDGNAIQRLRKCFGAHPGVECQLVLRADRSNAVNVAALQRFSPLSPSRLILTALDETPRLDGLRLLIARSALPVSFLGVGQRVPEDLEDASPSRLAELLHHGWPASRRAAA